MSKQRDQREQQKRKDKQSLRFAALETARTQSPNKREEGWKY